MKCAILLFIGSIIAQLSMAQNQTLQSYQPPSSPAVDYYKQQLTDQVLKQLDKIDWNHVERTTSGGTVLYTIPVVVHVLHNYGAELIPDTFIYKMIDTANSYFLKTNPDTVNIIDKFKPVAANTQIAFKLATKDPNGNPTKGVEHIFTYLTYGSASVDQPKINQWPQQRYLNLWTGYALSPYLFGYCYGPVSATYRPYYDGITMEYSTISYGKVFANCAAQYLNLPHPCDCCGGTCFDGDGIADTPPCSEPLYSCSNLYDTICDTPNTQNIMCNGDACGIMFTYGQGQYMQSVLQLDFGNRDSLYTSYNYSVTGMDQPMPDMSPVADFNVGIVSRTGSYPTWYFCVGQNVSFSNRSWNDTIIAASWSFSNNANIPASTSLINFFNSFHQPGWVTVSLAVTGNNTGTTTLTNSNALYIADSIPTSGVGYEQEFYAGADIDKWPMFNYYRNNFKWQLAPVGYFDNSCLEYTGYDTRSFPQNMTGTPQGDFDDIYTPGFDLTGFPDSCHLNFMSSGATITTDPHAINDSLEIFYSANHAVSWQRVALLKGEQLTNKGTITTPYTPASMSDWVAHAISLPAAARTGYTLFRFRYHPGANDTTGMSTGNNFYLDHFNFSSLPESVAVIDRMADGVTVQPNPTQGSTYVIIKDKTAIVKATIAVMDVTGKTVYETNYNSNSNTASIEIPGRVFTSKGLYLVHVTTGSMNMTEKLVVY